MPPDAALVCVVVAQPRPGKYFLGAGEFENGTDKRLLLFRIACQKRADKNPPPRPAHEAGAHGVSIRPL